MCSDVGLKTPIIIKSDIYLPYKAKKRYTPIHLPYKAKKMIHPYVIVARVQRLQRAGLILPHEVTRPESNPPSLA